MKHIFSFLFFLFFSFSAFALEKEAQREAIVTPRSKRFYPTPKARQYVSFGGIYSSDYNSKEYQLNSRYLYQSNKMVNEMNFDHEVKYADSGSGSNKKYGIKDEEIEQDVMRIFDKTAQTTTNVMTHQRASNNTSTNVLFFICRFFNDGAKIGI